MGSPRPPLDLCILIAPRRRSHRPVALTLCCIGAGIGLMPSRDTLAGIPTTGTHSIGAHVWSFPLGEGLTLTRGTVDTVANLLPNANPGLTPVTAGVYISDGLLPVPPALAAKIRQGAFVDMGELLPEFWAVSREEDSSMRADTKICHSR